MYKQPYMDIANVRQQNRYNYLLGIHMNPACFYQQYIEVIIINRQIDWNLFDWLEFITAQNLLFLSCIM